MRGWTFPVGRIFGVDIRIHMFFLLLLVLSGAYAGLLGVNVARGLALGVFLMFAVMIRETARALAGAWFAVKPRVLLLLPTGGLAAYDLDEEDDEPYPAREREALAKAADAKSRRAHRTIAIAGPAANIGCGLVLGGIILTFSPHADLVQMPWVTPVRLLRALVWINILLGAINLFPAWPLDGAKIFRGFGRLKTGSKSTVGLAPVLAILLIVTGLLMPHPNMWLIFMGIFVMVAAQFNDDGSPVAPSADATVVMRDVMMADYTVLSASATLEDAMRHATHTLQDVFPVVRGGNLVGAVSRQNIVDALETGGNSYVQGIMTRHFQTAQPGDPLMKTLRRIMAGQGPQNAQLVPILEDMNGEPGERIIGIITPQNLHRSMGLLNQSRRMRRDSDDRKELDKL